MNNVLLFFVASLPALVVAGSVILYFLIGRGVFSGWKESRSFLLTYPAAWLITYLVSYLFLWFDPDPHWLDNGRKVLISKIDLFGWAYGFTSVAQFLSVPPLMMIIHLGIHLVRRQD